MLTALMMLLASTAAFAEGPALGYGGHYGVMYGAAPYMHTGFHLELVQHHAKVPWAVGIEIGHHHWFDMDHSHLMVEDVHHEEDGDDHGNESHLEWGPVASIRIPLPSYWTLAARTETHLLPAIEGMVAVGPHYAFRALDIGVGYKLTMLELAVDPIDDRWEAVRRFSGAYALATIPMHNDRGERNLLVELAVYQDSWSNEYGMVQNGRAIQLAVGVDLHSD